MSKHSRSANRRGMVASNRAKGRSLGRRPGQNNTKEDLLYVSELEFADRGFDGASLQGIADKAKVNQALIKYYFGSKDRLFVASTVYRGQELREERLRRIDELEAQGGRPTVEEIVRAYLAPGFAIKREGKRGQAFWRLQARLQIEKTPLAGEARRRSYDKSIHRYIGALQRALPNVRRDEIYWRFIFMIGAFRYVVTDSHRLDALSGGRLNSRDIDDSLIQLVRFVAAGMKVTS